MEIDDRDDPRARREWMIREFQDARRRRLVKTSEHATPPATDTDADCLDATQPADGEARARRTDLLP